MQTEIKDSELVMMFGLGVFLTYLFMWLACSSVKWRNITWPILSVIKNSLSAKGFKYCALNQALPSG